MLERFRRLMTENGFDWFIVFTGDEHLGEYTSGCDRFIERLTSFSGSAGTLAVSESEAYLWTDSRYHIQAERELCGKDINLMRSGLPGVLPLEDFLASHVWDGQTVAFDHKTASYEQLRRLAVRLGRNISVTDGGRILRSFSEDMPEKRFGAIVSVRKDREGMSISEKIEKVRRRINKYVDEESYTYIISDLPSVMWLFNLRGEDINYIPVAYSYAMITAYSATLYVRKEKLTNDAASALEEASVVIRPYSEFYKDLDTVATDEIIADSFRNNARIIKRVKEICGYTDCEDAKIITKAVKNDVEKEGMISCHKKDAAVMIRFIKRIKEMAEEGTLCDEYDTGMMLDEMRHSAGSISPSFATICAYGENSAVVHYTATKEGSAKLKPEGFLLVDSGGQYEFEGTTDITRTISLGSLSDEQKEVYTTVLKGNLRLMDAVFPEGFEGTLLDAVAEEPLWQQGYFCGHGIGHGVGSYLSVHESEASITRRTRRGEIGFVPGVIVSDEPGVYLEGKFGVRLENLVLTIKADNIGEQKMCRFMPLTLVPFDKESIACEMLTEREKHILSEYNALIEKEVAPLLNENERIWLKEYMR